MGERFAPNALGDWRASLTLRIRELSAAVGAGEPRLFVSNVMWADKALRARERRADDLRSGLVCLREVLAEELPEAAGAAAGACVDQALQELAQPRKDGASGLDANDPNGRLALRYLRAILEGDGRRAVDLVVAAVDAGLDPREAYLDVLMAAQREIGNMWHANELCVAEEHAVTATTERAMSLLAQRFGRRSSNDKTVVAAAVAGNNHALGVRLVADFFEMAGWHAVCLGANLPPDDVASAALSYQADLVVISASRATEVKTVRASIDALRRLGDRELKILVGGGAFADAPELWRQLGADGYTREADEAVELGARLTSPAS